MKRFFLIAISLILSTSIFAMEPITKKGLVVLIDQETFGLHLEENQMLATVVNGLNSWATGKWDSLRADEAREIALHAYDDAYDNFYAILGADTRRLDIVKSKFDEAFLENSDVDVVFMFHGGRAKNRIPTEILNNNKLRLVLNEGCSDGDGSNHFIKVHGAMVSIGHNDGTSGVDCSAPSASPYHTFKFLRYWCAGLPLKEALQNAWTGFKQELESAFHYKVIQIISNCRTPEDSKKGTLVQYAHRQVINPETFTINNTCSHLTRDPEDTIIRGDSENLLNQ